MEPCSSCLLGTFDWEPQSTSHSACAVQILHLPPAAPPSTSRAQTMHPALPTQNCSVVLDALVSLILPLPMGLQILTSHKVVCESDVGSGLWPPSL